MGQTRLEAGFHLMAKPAGAACNLSCQYCFYLPKKSLDEEPASLLMSDDIQECYLQQLLENSADPEVTITWQGGEPMLRGLDFFRKSIELANRYCQPHQKISHAIQTNGTLIDAEWAAFFKANNFLVGLSLDGPQFCHDAYRRDRHDQGSFDEVIKGWHYLEAAGVDVNILCTVHVANQDYPLEIYRFFRDELKAQYIQMIPIVESAFGSAVIPSDQHRQQAAEKSDQPDQNPARLVSNRTVNPEKFGKFLNTIFDEWVRKDVGQVFVTNFDMALGSWLGQHNSCINAPTCGTALVIEHNGDVYCCDHFVESAYRLGNITKTPLKTLLDSELLERFGNNKFDSLPQSCRRCPVLFACYGECPRNRLLKTADGEAHLNYLCAGYKMFFTHIDPAMQIMAQLLRQGHYVDEIRSMFE